MNAKIAIDAECKVNRHTHRNIKKKKKCATENELFLSQITISMYSVINNRLKKISLKNKNRTIIIFMIVSTYRH